MVNLRRIFCCVFGLILVNQAYGQHVPIPLVSKSDSLKKEASKLLADAKGDVDSLSRLKLRKQVEDDSKILVEHTQTQKDALVKKSLDFKNKLGRQFNDSSMISALKLKLKTSLKKNINQKVATVADSILQKKKDAPKIPFAISSVALLGGVNYTNSAVTQPRNWVTNAGIEAQVKIYGAPINVNLSNNFPNMANRSFSGSNLFKLDYNAQEMLKDVIPGVSKYQNFAKQKLKNIDYAQYARTFVVDQLKETNFAKVSQQGSLFNYINKKGSLEKMLAKPKEEVKELVDSLLTLDAEKILAQRSKVTSNVSFIDSIAHDIETIESEILGLKSELDALGINPQNIAQLEKLIDGKLSPYQFLQEMPIKEQLSQVPFFNRIANINTGNFGANLPGSFTNKELFLDGVDVGIRTGKGIARLGISNIHNQDSGPSNFSFPRLLGYVGIPLYQSGGRTGELIWSGYTSRMRAEGIAPLNVSPQAGSAFTVSQSFKNDQIGKLTFEVSKSSTSFSNLSAINSPGMYIDRGTFGNYFRDDLFETMSFGVRYVADLAQEGLKTDAYFSYSGLGYQSPAQQSIANMGIRAGGTLRKSFYKNRVMLLVRGDLKNTPMASDASAYWQNQNFQVEAKVKLLKKLNMAMKVLNNSVIKNTEVAAPMFHTRKYQFDMTSSYRLGKLSNFSKLSIGSQTMTNPLNLMQTGFVTVNYLQTLVFKTFSLNGSVLYNKENSGIGLIGNVLNGDLAAQFALSNKLNLSSGLTYLDNQQIARQLGIKQSLNFNPSERLTISCYFDVRKDLIESTMPGLYANRNAEVSLKYIFIK